MDSLEIVLAPPEVVAPTALAGMLPPVPFAATPSTTLTTLTVVPLDSGLLRLDVAGTTAESPLVAPVAFTYALEFSIIPSADLHRPDLEVLDITAPGKGTVTFAGTGSVGSQIEASLLTTFQGFALSKIFPVLRDTLKARLNAAVLASLAGRIAPGTTTLPAGIILSVRTVEVRATTSAGRPPGVTVRAALGAFGGVFSKLPPLPPISTGNKLCFVATAAVGADAPDVLTLQRFRDHFLLERRAGRLFVRGYEGVAPALARRISRSKTLQLLARVAIVRPAAAVASWIMSRPRVRSG